MSLSKEKILESLCQVTDESAISGIVIDGARVGFALEGTDDDLRLKAEKAVFAIPGVEKVTAVLTSSTGKITVENKGAEVLDRKQPIAGVKKIIAVASGKGGVGKSTIAANLAIVAAKSGKNVGLVDADIYGPSVPLLMNLENAAKPDVQDNLMIPIKSNGVHCASIGLLMGEEQPAIWRGPMATKAIHQLFRGSKWDIGGELDILFIDMPPGTGDIHLSIAQNYPIDGAIIITTPQELALADVKKAVKMFERVNIPILGMLENMSYFVDSAGNKNFPFGENGGKKLAQELEITMLAEIPLSQNIKPDDLSIALKTILPSA